MDIPVSFKYAMALTLDDYNTVHNRDINAAINIHNRGILDITAGTAGLASLCLAR